MKVVDVQIGKIDFSNRYRKELGDIAALAENIRECGLLQPIGVDQNFKLICGERRVLAFIRLNRETIPAVILKLDSLIAGEYAENEFRKQFTPSERAAIGKALEAELGNRKGANQHTRKNGDPHGETVDIAAKRAGFKSAETFRAAQKVTERGSEELVAAMDEGKVSIAAAASIASQPKPDQNRIIELPKEKQRAAISLIRKSKADREANERRARDIYLFRGLYNAVKFIAEFNEGTRETWDGLWRVSAYDFSDHLNRALEYLPKLKKEHPNAAKRPLQVS
jgi:ParB family chromosome partitioning protein